MKPYFLALFLFPAFAQAQILKTTFQDTSGKTCNESSAEYIIQYEVHPDDTSKFISIKRDRQGRLVEENELKSYDPTIQDGLSKLYNVENGKVVTEGNFESGRWTGIWKYYDNNGRLKEVIDLDIPKNTGQTYKIMEAYDSLGNQLVSNGNGNYATTLNESVYVNKNDTSFHISGFTSGNLINGFKNGIWVGQYLKSKDNIHENWSEGMLISGTRTDSLGKIFNYKVLFVQPTPEGGMQEFYKFIGNNLKYPKEARKWGIEGKVFVQFVVEATGLLSEIRVIKGIGYGCNEEVLRVINKSPNWKPGIERGKPLKTRMILPLTFKLS